MIDSSGVELLYVYSGEISMSTPNGYHANVDQIWTLSRVEFYIVLICFILGGGGVYLLGERVFSR